MYYVYAIRNSVGRIYVGMTQDVANRVEEHNRGTVFSTKGYRPWRLVYSEVAGITRGQARLREKYWKSGIGKERLKSLPL